MNPQFKISIEKLAKFFSSKYEVDYQAALDYMNFAYANGFMDGSTEMSAAMAIIPKVESKEKAEIVARELCDGLLDQVSKRVTVESKAFEALENDPSILYSVADFN